MHSNSRIISTGKDPSLRIESSAIINLCGVSTKLNKYIIFTTQTYSTRNLIIQGVSKKLERNTNSTGSHASHVEFNDLIFHIPRKRGNLAFH